MDIELEISFEMLQTQIEELLACAEKIKLLSEPLTSIDSTIK